MESVEDNDGISIADRGDKTGVNVALLRGINVGGKNKLRMKDLTAIFGDMGCVDVRTYIQSGNVLFRADQTLASGVASLISNEVLSRFGFQVPVVTRTALELQDIVQANPFVEAGVDADKLHIAFLADLPNGPHVAALDPDRSPGDEFVVLGREVYLHCPSGMARTKLTNSFFDSRLSTTSTIRNWKTALKLLDLATTAG